MRSSSLPGPRPGEATLAGALEDLAQIRHAGEDRRQRLEVQLGEIGKQACNRGLAASGWAPKDHRGEAASGHHAADGALGADQMILAEHALERPRTQSVRQGPRRLGLEKTGHRNFPLSAIKG